MWPDLNVNELMPNNLVDDPVQGALPGKPILEKYPIEPP